jgi:hypothetical protein
MRFQCALIASLIGFQASIMPAAMVSIKPIVGQADSNNGVTWFIASSASSKNITVRWYEWGYESRALMEYALPNLPPGATVVSASMVLDIVEAPTDGRGSALHFSGYSGNGSLDISDPRNADYDRPMATTGTIASVGPHELFDVNASGSTGLAAFLQGLIDNGDTYAGFVGWAALPNASAAFGSFQGEYPTLNIEYIPEPSSLILLAASVLIGVRRRKPVASSRPSGCSP